MPARSLSAAPTRLHAGRVLGATVLLSLAAMPWRPLDAQTAPPEASRSLDLGINGGNLRAQHFEVRLGAVEIFL